MSKVKTDLDADPERLIEAAIKIQRIWRRYIDLQVFKYYKDLVIFHNEGDPALIMKYINPIEAKLIDSASGIHIKFRLAGHQFPPTIYYKIFTHRPVQDICANAPRDYTKPFMKKKTAQCRNNKEKYFPIETIDGWYKRIENNGWRPVSTKHLMQMNNDYYYGYEKYKDAFTFQHARILRRQDQEIKRKEKKIEWMKKMYKNGMLQTKTDDIQTKQIIEEATKSIIDTYDNRGIGAVEDWEVDELLEWTNALSFEEYLFNWKTIGTSTQSDKLAKQRNKQFKLEKEDTFDIQDSLNFSRPIMEASTPMQSTHRQYKFQNK